MNISPTLSNLILIFFLQFAITTVTGQRCKAEQKEPWSYKGYTNGPDRWKKTFKTCGKRMQSPIYIDTSSVESSDLPPLELVNYDRPLTRAGVENDGHTVVVTPRDRTGRFVVIDDKRYRLRQFHFHWNKDTEDGTEHAIDGKRYGMEIHFVHEGEDNDTAVIGILNEVTSEPNEALQEIVKVLPKIPYINRNTYYKGSIDLQQFFPESPISYYRYEGSLTTPPCTQGVSWTVLKEVMQIGEDQLSEFLKLYSVSKNDASEDCRMTRNVRPLQKRNGRAIYESS